MMPQDGAVHKTAQKFAVYRAPAQGTLKRAVRVRIVDNRLPVSMNSTLARGGKSLLISTANRRQGGGARRAAFGLRQQAHGVRGFAAAANGSRPGDGDCVWRQERRGLMDRGDSGVVGGRRLLHNAAATDKEPEEVCGYCLCILP